MSSRSTNRADEAEIVYTISNPFHRRDSEILVLEESNNNVEIIIGNIPIPKPFHFGGWNIPGGLESDPPYSVENDSVKPQHSVANWILSETTSILSGYELSASSHVANSGHEHLADIYFICDKTEVENAVLSAKKFLIELEKKTLDYNKEFDNLTEHPRKKLSE